VSDAALKRLVFLDGCADQSPDWKQAWLDAMATAQAALAGHDRQIGSSADTGILDPPIATDAELIRVWDACKGADLLHRLRATYNLGRQHWEHGAAANSKPTPNDRQIGSLSDALIKAECALADIAEGEPTTDEGDPLKWNQQRCADTLSIIRPVMQHHGIRTSEWPGSGFNPPQPLPAPAGALKESLTDVWNEGFRLRRHAASDVIEVIARWLEHQQDIPTGVSADYFAALLRKEAGR